MTPPAPTGKSKYILAALFSFALALVVTVWLKKRSLESTLQENTTNTATEQIAKSTETANENEEQDFADLLTTEFKSFDLEKITTRIENYNAEIRKKFQLTDEQQPAPKDFNRFELTDLPNYAVLNQEIVERSHSDGVDDGLDSTKTSIFSKKPFQKVLSIAGPVYLIPHTEKMISIPTESSCKGREPKGSGRVYDLKTKKEIFKFDFPEGAIDTIVLENTKSNEFHFDIVQELPLAESQTTCEMGDPVQSIKSSYQISCQNDSASCLLVANEIERTEGCPHIGGCD